VSAKPALHRTAITGPIAGTGTAGGMRDMLVRGLSMRGVAFIEISACFMARRREPYHPNGPLYSPLSARAAA
jgi:hypothetical protein